MEVILDSRTGGVSYTPSTSENEAQIDPIDFNDIFLYYDFEPAVIKDKQVAEILRQNKKKRIQLKVDRLNRILPQIYQFLPNFSPLEFYIAFDIGCGDPDQIILQATKDKNFIKRVKSEAKEQVSLLDPKIRQKRSKQLEAERERELNAEEEEEENECQSETDTDSSSDSLSDSDESDDSDDSDADTHKHTAHHIQTRSQNKHKETKSTSKKEHITHKHHRMKDQSKKNDLPLPDGVDPKIWHKWSTIHQASYLAGITNPNTYFYRNVAPGEKQKNGPWSAEEKKLFLKRLEEVRQEGSSRSQWGIFSQAIPGRVGYQCANFYRKLILNKEIEDPSYFTDEDGVLRHKKTTNEGNRSPGKNKGQKDDEPQLSLYEKLSQQNPLNRAIDGITNEIIKVPALSPDGYLLDYNTWLKFITKNAKDPFTQNHINKRQLIILTKENIDEYRDKIKNLQFEE